MKLSRYEKDELNCLVDDAIEAGAHIISLPDARCTVLIIPASLAHDRRFYHLVLAYCSPDDRWNKKRGIYEVLKAYYFERRYISVPYSNHWRDLITQGILNKG